MSNTLATFALGTTLVLAQMSFSDGHIDAFHVTDGPAGLTLDLKEDVTGSNVRRAPEDVIITVPDSAYTEGTSGLPGIERPTWHLPQTQVAGLPWPGWDTQGAGTAVDIHFVDVTGPGTVFLWQQGSFGDIQPVTADGSLWLFPGSVIPQPNPAHVHANWGFDAPGTYTMVVTATSANDQSNTATYTWIVGEAGSAGDGVDIRVDPAGPADPADPAGPADPAHPGARAAPAAPVDPADPEGASDPSDPRDPAAAPAASGTPSTTPGARVLALNEERELEQSTRLLLGGAGILVVGASMFMLQRRKK